MSQENEGDEGTGETGESAVAGWYPDPGGSGQERYWDGSGWTEHMRPGTGAAQPAAAPSQAMVAVPVVATYKEPKSVGLAVFLSILLPGVGHLYAGVKRNFGITFLVISVLNDVLGFGVGGMFALVLGAATFGLGCVLLCIPFLIWGGMALWASIDVSQAMKEQQFIQAG